MHRILLATAAALLLLTGAASAMSYRVATFDDGRCTGGCPQAIVAEGAIEVDEARRLAAFIRGAGAGIPAVPRVMLLHSPGGNLAGALELGLGLRRLGMRTMVARVGRTGGRAPQLATGVCGSACVFVLMSGQERLVPPGSRVVVHAAKRYGGYQRDIVGSGYIDARTDEGAIVNLMQGYAREMGVDPGLISLAQSVPHESARVLSPSEIGRFRLATVGGAARARRSR